MNYIELLKKYNFEEVDLNDLKEISDGFEDYIAVYEKEIKTGERITLGINNNTKAIDIGWCASGIDMEENAFGWMLDSKTGLEFLQILLEACEIIKEYDNNLGEID